MRHASPAGRINSILKAMDSPQIAAREMLVEVEQPGAGKIPIPGVAIKLSKTPGRVETPAPRLGQHSELIYCNWLGFSSQEFARLKEEGVI